MWTYPGQKKALDDRHKILTAIAKNRESVTDCAKTPTVENVPPIKTIAVFRAEGSGQSRYLFPPIYTDILLALPADVISRNDVDDNVNEA